MAGAERSRSTSRVTVAAGSRIAWSRSVDSSAPIRWAYRRRKVSSASAPAPHWVWWITATSNSGPSDRTFSAIWLMKATSLITSGVTRPPTLRRTIASLSPRPRMCAGSTRGSKHVITNRRRLGKTTAPWWPPAAAKARLRSSAGSMLAVVIVLFRSGEVEWSGARRLRCRDGARSALAQPDPVVHPPQRFWCPPVPRAEQCHQRWHQQGADDRGVDQHRERHAESQFLDEHELRYGK